MFLALIVLDARKLFDGILMFHYGMVIKSFRDISHLVSISLVRILPGWHSEAGYAN